jgi:AraC family transcriptional regulator, regulatory protein of adaptative response / DNA-3-methyladenine glycosylase II
MDTLDPAHCYRALRSHDARFDGRFFVGVATTRIYCRPVCTARTPLRANCRFYPSAAAAEAHGFRPCLRCRPELAPGHAAVDATRRLAQAAAGLIEDGSLTDARLPQLAQRLGVTDRHLRRVFREEFGVAPVEYAQTQRLLLAKRLLTDTAMPVLDVAMASGFASLRRFNHLFRSRYRLAPGELRRVAPARAQAPWLSFELAYRPPYDWEAMLAFLERRAIPGVEHVEAGTYQRSLRIAHAGAEVAGRIQVSPSPRRAALRVRVEPAFARCLPAVLARVKRLFDLACHPEDVAQGLGELAAAHPGLRLPGAVDGFELAVRAILGQQVTVRAARTLAGRFAAAFGLPMEPRGEAVHLAFPSASAIALLDPAQIARLGIVGARARALIAVSREVDAGRMPLEPSADVADTLDKLLAVPGIGPWTAHYIAMRALSWPDAFPMPDAGLVKALGERSTARALARAQAWQPWRSYAVMHLWKSLEGSA